MTSVAAASNEEGPVVAGNRRGSWRAELLALWRSRGGSARDELRALALVASVVVSLDVLERTVEFAVAGAASAPMSLRLWAQANAGRLSIDLSTSLDVLSRGVSADPRLEQIGDRLRALYGEEARFECRDASIGPGSLARMELPLDLGLPETKVTP